jgi:Protein of unknown function (DUF2795)
MNIDPNMINQVLNKIPYPIGKDQLIQLARKQGVNDQVTSMLDKFLPNKTFNSAQDLQSLISNMGKSGGNTGGMGSGQQI